LKIDFVGIVLIIGAIQGFALAFLIFQKGRTLFANRFLYSLMLVFSVTLVSLWLSDLGYYLTYPKMMFTFEGIQLTIFPLYFLYAKYLTRENETFNKKDWLHFLPFLLYKLFLIPFYFMNQNEIFDFLNSSLISEHPLQYIIFNWVLIFQGLVYLILVINRVKKRDEFINEYFSSNFEIKLDWLKNASYLGILTTLVFMTENILLFINNRPSETFGLSSVAAGVYIYAIGYLGLSRSGVFTELTHIELKDIDLNIKQNNSELYEKSGLTSEKADVYQQQLLQLMESEKPYRNNKLTLSELASMLLISSHNLSEIINTKENKNFFDFINQYRIEEVKKELVNPKNSNLTILAIAMDAGFNSKTSFNTLFKKFIGKTPSQYKDSLKGN